MVSNDFGVRPHPQPVNTCVSAFLELGGLFTGTTCPVPPSPTKVGLVEGGWTLLSRVSFTSAPQVTSQTSVVTAPWSQSENQPQNVPKMGVHLFLVLNVTVELFWEGATWRSKPALHVGAVADLPGKRP